MDWQKKNVEVELEDDDEAQFVLDDYESDDEFGGKRQKESDDYSPAVKELMVKYVAWFCG